VFGAEGVVREVVLVRARASEKKVSRKRKEDERVDGGERERDCGAPSRGAKSNQKASRHQISAFHDK